MRSSTANCAKFAIAFSDGNRFMEIQKQRLGRCIVVFLLGLAAAGLVYGVTEAEVDRLGQDCEAVRQKALAPIRADRTRACIEQQLRSKGHCERYYTTYGNVTIGPTGAPKKGYFYDLPECQDWLEARKKLEAERSRP